MTLYDITLPLHDKIAVWPGDVPFRLERSLSIANGDPINLSSITLSVHAGTHMDAPFHFNAEGKQSDSFDLSVCVGRALVIDVAGQDEITRTELARLEIERVERLLLKTGGWPKDAPFPHEVPTLALDVPEFLQSYGVKLLGLDLPSVDRIRSKQLPIHNALMRRGITILESLYLAETPEGLYELIALPISIVGADGAPVRAILRGIEDERN